VYSEVFSETKLSVANSNEKALFLLYSSLEAEKERRAQDDGHQQQQHH
jgi:hypothetical protein